MSWAFRRFDPGSRCLKGERKVSETPEEAWRMDPQ